jgi:hypothetical protein
MDSTRVASLPTVPQLGFWLMIRLSRLRRSGAAKILLQCPGDSKNAALARLHIHRPHTRSIFM